MKIQKIEISNFKGFRSNYGFDLNNSCKNLLIYGENGSGKSSLYWALKLCLEYSRDASLEFSKNKNFLNTDAREGFVKLHLDNEKEYIWSDTKNDALNAPEFIEAIKASGFIDYKSLLRTYFLPYIIGGKTTDMFPLLIELFSNVINDYTGNTFGDDWRIIKTNIPRRNTERQLTIIQGLIENFNVGFRAKLIELLKLANEILNDFEYQIEIDQLYFSELLYDKPTHLISNQFVEMKIKFQSSEVLEHHYFLNEAKLSAIAISIHFASLLLTPETDLRILVLDDVLIGLDMSNRFPVIKMLNERFGDYQIFLFTYDRAWFEIIQQYMSQSTWKSIELYCDTTHGFEMPVYVESKEYLEKAKEHLINKDYKASVVYVRSAFEYILKKYCIKHMLPVKYKQKQRKYSCNDFWTAVINEGDLIPEELENNIKVHRTHILNPLCHDDPVLAVEVEIQRTIQIIEELQSVLIEVSKKK